MEKIDSQLKEKINKKIASMGIKKSYLAKEMGLDPVRFSQTINGIRKIQPSELSALNRSLGLAI